MYRMGSGSLTLRMRSTVAQAMIIHSTIRLTLQPSVLTASSQSLFHSSGYQSKQKSRPPGTDLAAEANGRFVAFPPGCSHNGRVIEIFEKLCDVYSKMGDVRRARSYLSAIDRLRIHDKAVTTGEEAKVIPGIGSSIADKIEEIGRTGGLKKLEELQNDPEVKALQLFMGITGVGKKQADAFVRQGYRTLADLEVENTGLTKVQKLGIEHYDDLSASIPRDETKTLESIVLAASAQIDPAVHLVVGGSYRRGAKTSGDIDFIVSKAGTSSSGELSGFLKELLNRLTADGFIVATLVESFHGGIPWQGCCILPLTKGKVRRRWRRIDFLLAPESTYGAALLYFTGSNHFNVQVRTLARKKGMTLGPDGLFMGTAKSKGKLVEAKDEGKIFEALGVDWREPTDRWWWLNAHH
ncbi:hypothetical protein F4778DRAFT_746706 [Xylariomycetidae sp. FL2044]|nr:hypothetical protein F4778DRAFT_746706 [Xylariomycetidae sp. FL2044]